MGIAVTADKQPQGGMTWDIDELNDFNKWRETVRMIYDSLHFGNHNVKGGKPAKQIVKFIEDRHPTYFGYHPEEK